MRWLLIGLMLLNITTFVWFWRASPVVGQDASVAIDAVEASSPLVLLSELNPHLVKPLSQLPVSEAAVSACYELGAFQSRSDAEQFALSYGDTFSVQINSRQLQTRIDYRVYLSPYISREAATEAIEELRAQFKADNLAIDSLLITQGDLANGIALGLFSDQRNALNVEAQLDRLGYQVQITEEPRMREEFWVLLIELPGGARLLSQWSDMQQQRAYLQRTEKLC